jgi:fido (protein-threonine AMPylation protein)
VLNDEEKYITQSEPNYTERSYYWKTAIGLQKVDGLTPSDYLIQTANANIEGKISFKEAEKLITEYYEQKPAGVDESRSEEADKVSLRITGLLSEKTFTLSPIELMSIHKRLFDNIYDFAGKIREHNVSKNEWVLGGETVFYASAYNIRETLDYDFAREKEFSFAKLDARAAVEHITKFISDLWQIHAFGEGNTRAVAVFTIKYLRTFGYDVTNDTFEKYSLYFRNALVRANYNNKKHGISATYEYLNLFFGNLLFGEINELRNRELHIGFGL